MLSIRMRRVGSKKQPFYRVVVCDSAKATDGRFVEILGYYNPRTDPETVEVNRERLAHWLNRGARASDTVRTLINRHPIGVAEAAEGVEATTS